MRIAFPSGLAIVLVAAYAAVFFAAPKWVDVYAYGTLFLLSGASLIRGRLPGAVRFSPQVAGGLSLLFAGFILGELQHMEPPIPVAARVSDLVPGALCIAAFILLFRAYLRSSAGAAAEPVAAPDNAR